MSSSVPPVVLFGYDSSPFTQKVRLVLRLRQIPYTYVLVSSMMPRPVMLENFNLTYRKIPVLAIGKELYVDTSLIIEALATHPSFSATDKYPALHQDENVRALSRILSSHYTDRPLFRLTTGLIPQTVWDTSFGDDRAELIGHKLNAAKLGAKFPRNLAGLDTFLSILEPSFASEKDTWFLGTASPTLADIALYYQLDWGEKISRGDGINSLTGGGTADGTGEGISSIFNQGRYPGIIAWFNRTRDFFEGLPNVETRIEQDDGAGLSDLFRRLNGSPQQSGPPMIPTSPAANTALDARNGLKLGARVSVAPADTGRGSPTNGEIVGLGTEEVVITPSPIDGLAGPSVQGVRIHFPRVEFLISPSRSGQDAERSNDRASKAKL